MVPLWATEGAADMPSPSCGAVIYLCGYVFQLYLCRYYEIMYGAGFKKGDTVSLLDTFRRQQELSEAGVANGGAAKAGADADTNMDAHTGVATVGPVPVVKSPRPQFVHRRRQGCGNACPIYGKSRQAHRSPDRCEVRGEGRVAQA